MAFVVCPLSDVGTGVAVTRKKSEASLLEEVEEEWGATRSKHFQFQKLALNLQFEISCLTAHAKFIALGGYDGSIRLAQHSGTLLSDHDYHLHCTMICNISIEEEGKFVGSCSSDGTVSIIKCSNKKFIILNFKGPVNSIALNPFFASDASNKNFVISNNQELLLSDCEGNAVPLHTSESDDGKITAVKWKGNYIAMATKKNLFVYSTDTKDCIGHITIGEREEETNDIPCSLCWMNDRVLLLGYENSVKMIDIKEKASLPLQQSTLSVVCRYILPSDMLVCSSVVLLNNMKVVLGYTCSRQQEEQVSIPSSPHLSVIVLDESFVNKCWEKDEKISELKLKVERCDYDCTRYYDPCNHHLECDTTTDCNNQIYIQTPKSIIVGCKIDANEHIDWLMATGKIEEAMSYAEDNVDLLTKGKLKDTGLFYIHHLIKEMFYKKAARKCQDLLDDPNDWQHIIEKFIDLRVLPIILPYIPKGGNLRLSKDFYQIILNHLLSIPEELCKVVQEWPTDLYNPTLIVDAVTLQLIDLEATNAAEPCGGEMYHFKYHLLKVKAKLSEYKGDISSALKIYLRISDGRSFDLIKEKSLYDLLIENLQSLFEQGAMKTVELLIEFHKYISTKQVVEKVKKFPKSEGDKRYLLFRYLDALFEVNPVACEEFHELQLELYSVYNRKKVIQLIKSYSNFVNLQEILEFCTNEKLYEACLYILDHMGNYKAALQVIVSKLGDVDQAFAFVREKKDCELEDHLLALLKNYTDSSSSANTELLDSTSRILVEANAHLVEEVANVQSNYQTLQREKEEQEQMVEYLLRELDDTRQTILALQEEHNQYTQLNNRFAQLEKQHNLLKAQQARSKLPYSHQRLQQENTQLQEEKAQLNTRYTQLQQTYNQLEQQYNEWSQRYVELLQRNNFLEAQLNSMMECSQTRFQEPAATVSREKEETWRISHNDISLSETELGKGSWGVVYMGEFRGQTVAVKQMHDEINSSLEYISRLHQEIQTMSQLRHPNLLQFIGAVFDHPSGNPMIITEVMDTSLRKAYEDCTITPDQRPVILSIMRDVAVGLNYLHCLPDPIIHRDVSSANVLLERKGNDTAKKWKTKLSDFGSARRVQLAVTQGPGAEVYCAPECLQSIMSTSTTSQSTKMDVFSYGILLCEILTCQFPCREIIQKMLDGIRISSDSLYSLVTNCTHNDSPGSRYSMKQVIEQIDTYTVFCYQ